MDINRVKLATCDEEREAIFRFRYCVYCEDGRPDRLALDHQRGMFIEELDDARALQLYRTAADSLVGVFRLNMLNSVAFSSELASWLNVPPFAAQWNSDGLAYGSRLMVSTACRDNRLGGELLGAAFRCLRQRQVRFAFMYCKPHLRSLYEHFGFRACGATFEHPISGTNVPLVCALGDIRHFERVGSPVLSLAQSFEPDEQAAQWLDMHLHALGPACLEIS
jgi:predicted GNAT family N-acyltransferase